MKRKGGQEMRRERKSKGKKGRDKKTGQGMIREEGG